MVFIISHESSCYITKKDNKLEVRETTFRTKEVKMLFKKIMEMRKN